MPNAAPAPQRREVVDVKEVSMRPFYGRAMLAWLLDEARAWQAKGNPVSLVGRIDHGRQFVRLIVFACPVQQRAAAIEAAVQ